MKSVRFCQGTRRFRKTVALPLTVSLGVAASVATASVSELIARADLALYEAKGRGRNRVVVADVPPEA